MRTTLPAARNARPRRENDDRFVDVDPYVIEDSALTLDEWRFNQNHAGSVVELVRLHHPGSAQLVA